MPEHVHLLIFPLRRDYSVSAILGTIKLPVTRRAATFVRQHAPTFMTHLTDLQPNGKRSLRFWQRGGGYDRNLWSPRHIWETIEYLHANAVRRELCDHPLDWPWSSARHYEDR
jgi:putative transposase